MAVKSNYTCTNSNTGEEIVFESMNWGIADECWSILAYTIGRKDIEDLPDSEIETILLKEGWDIEEEGGH